MFGCQTSYRRGKEQKRTYISTSLATILAALWTIFLHCKQSSVATAASTNNSPVHVLVLILSCQVVRGLSRTLVSGMVPLTIVFSKQVSGFRMTWPKLEFSGYYYYYYYLYLGRSSRGGRQKLILEIITLMVNHQSGSHQRSSRAAG